MTSTPLDDIGPIDIALTVDDLILWDHAPLAPGRTSLSVTESLAHTLKGIEGGPVWAFPHTSPIEREPANRAVFEAWVDAGHHLGNHTHAHAPLNWVDGDTYCRDIDRAEQLIGDLVALAPARYFRYAMDMVGPSEARRGQVQDYLGELGYTNAPITTWFGDFAWTVPYYRAITTGNREAAAMLRESYVAAALASLAGHATTARRIFGRDIPYIFLIHASAIAQDCLPEILETFQASGVRFVNLETAMQDVHHRAQPPVDRRFRNHLQRWAFGAGTEVPSAPPELLQEVLSAAPMEGPYADSIAAYDELLGRLYVTGHGTTYDWDWS